MINVWQGLPPPERPPSWEKVAAIALVAAFVALLLASQCGGLT